MKYFRYSTAEIYKVNVLNNLKEVDDKINSSYNTWQTKIYLKNKMEVKRIKFLVLGIICALWVCIKID